jgi:hypothetical protein
MAHSTTVTPVRPHYANIGPGTLFSYAMFSLERGEWVSFEDRWLVVEAQSHGVQAGIGPTCSITALNQWGRLNRTHLYPTDRIWVHCE